MSGTEGNADENSEGFVVTQEYIQNSMFITLSILESESLKNL